MARIAFVPYPPTSFPYRDLLVLEQLSLDPAHRVCEVGVGSGETTARLARLCAEVTGFEISAPTVGALGYLEKRHRNLRLVAADITDAEALADYSGRFDRLLSCDTLEHVPDPAGFFRGAAQILAPAGELAITFPNEPKKLMHGVTRFDSPLELAQLAQDAGFEDLRLGAARLSPHAARVAERLGWKPLSLAREVVALGRGMATWRRQQRGDNGVGAPPQVFEDTRFFRTMWLWRPLSPAVNLYWYGVLRLMAARGPAFTIDWDFCDTAFEHCQVFLTGRKSGAGPAA